MTAAETPAPGEPPRGDISPKLTSTTRVEHGLLVPMRDGTRLSLDLIRPELPHPLPVVLARTPYDKVLERSRREDFYVSLAQRGYIVALQDCRGRFNSDGEFFPYFDEIDDGYDTVEWIGAQEWCDGNVGMTGGSYVGQTQWYAAVGSPRHLKAIVPAVSPPGDLFTNEPIWNGIFLLAFGEWMRDMGRRSFQDSEFVEIWKRGSYDDWSRISAPALNLTGWYDMSVCGAPRNFEAMRASGGTEDARRGQKLVIGPWPHWVNSRRELNGIDFGDHALIELDDYVVRYFDRWLKGKRNGIDDEKPVYVFVMGANEWRAEEDWPLPGTEYVNFYLHSDGRANSLKGDGGLSREQPGTEPPDHYRYDPADPVRVLWNMHDGPVDDRVPSTRDDVLCYTSERLAEPLDVIGWVSCHLYASSSARDTDWHVRLVDVHPDGSARFLCQGALRARFRDSLEEPELLEPDTVYPFELRMDPTGIRFLPGHRIRVEITSSWLTRWDRNTNSGAPNNFLDASPVVADQTVYHERGRASHVVLPVQPRR